VLFVVTGAAGFVGSAVVRALTELGVSVRGCDRTPAAPVPAAEWFTLDILDANNLGPLMLGADCVVHAAGSAHQRGTHHTIRQNLVAVNVKGTQNVVRAAVGAGVRRFVLVSSVSVYGARAAGPCNEDCPPCPLGAYAESKFEAERQAIAEASAGNMSLCILRLATVYGEGDPGNVARLVRAIDRGRFVWIGSGSNLKTLVHREDAGRACAIAAWSLDQPGGTFNVAEGAYPLRGIVETIVLELGASVPRFHIPAPPIRLLSRAVGVLARGRGRLEMVRHTLDRWLSNDVYDGTRFRQIFDFHPVVGLREGLQREVAWYQGLMR
jgi:nucleoside-diphosphate-sugar epimerase